jgi:signal transduction histidine kinase
MAGGRRHRLGRLVLLIAATTAVPLFTLFWLAWQLLQQDQILERQQIVDRTERTADLVVAALQRAIAITERRVASGDVVAEQGAVTFTFEGGRITAQPAGAVAFLPVAAALEEAPADAFAQGELLEYRRRDRSGAVGFYRRAVTSRQPAIRATAALHLGRNLKEMGNRAAALDAYALALDGAAVSHAGTPVSVIARYARCELLEAFGGSADVEHEAQGLMTALHTNAPHLSSADYRLYSADARRWLRQTSTPPDDRELMASVAAELWRRRGGQDSSSIEGSRELLVINGEPIVVLWQPAGAGLRAFAATSRFVDAQWLGSPSILVTKTPLAVELRDRAGRSVARSRSARFDAGKGAQISRTAAQAELPWSITVAAAPTASSEFDQRRTLLILELITLVAMAMAVTYLAVRWIGRELALVRLQSEFVATVSHEFRTPLTALRQFTDILRDHARLTDVERRQCYDAQSRATERLTRLVESLLDFNRIDAGAVRYGMSPVDLGDVARGVIRDFRQDVAPFGYQITLDCDRAVFMRGDAAAIARAIWNLLDNAVKYSPDERHIVVQVRASAAHCVLSVVDRGIGIPTGERDAIFTRFHRGADARARGITGTGIGLSMVDEIVRAHGGRIRVESEPGQGSRFSLEFPSTTLDTQEADACRAS